MSLNWVRLDSNQHSNDKIVALLEHPQGARAFTLYTLALGWSGGHATDGHIPPHILRVLVPWPQPKRLAAVLVEHELWAEHLAGGWCIRNFAERQELSVVAAAKKAAKTTSARKANCVRHHGPECHCWKEAA
jgi:hypothetical protein